MASGTFYPAIGADDGNWTSAGFVVGNSYMRFGKTDAGAAHHTFIRFPSVNIPKSSVITAAFVRFTSFTTKSTTVVDVNIYFNDIDNAIAPTSKVEADALVLTTNFTNWNPGSWIDDIQYDAPSLVTALQEVVDRSGWNNSNAVQVIIKDNASDTNAERLPSAIEHLAGAEKAELHVTWTPPAYNINVTNPSIQGIGYTGISATPSILMPQVQGYTGIYSALSISMTQPEGFTGITAEPSISMPITIMVGSDNVEHMQATATIPSISARMDQAEQIWGNVTIPSMVAKFTERETTFANASIPMATAELFSGIHADLEATASMATVEGLFSNQAEISVPMIMAEIEGKVGVTISSAIKVPGMTVEATGKTEQLINCAVSVSMPRVNTKLMAGKLIAGAAEIPIAVADLSSYEDIIGDINASISMVEAYMIGTAERAVCPILRYDDKPDCIGNITEEIPMIEVSLTEV